MPGRGSLRPGRRLRLHPISILRPLPPAGLSQTLVSATSAGGPRPARGQGPSKCRGSLAGGGGEKR